MRYVKLLCAAVFASFLMLGVMAQAATEAKFDRQNFASAQQAGKPILVDVTASWCPTCAKQRPILSQLMKGPEFKDLVVYQVDFDTQKDVVRAMGAQMQSTLIAFHGASEKGRSTGDTNAQSIRSLLEKAKG